MSQPKPQGTDLPADPISSFATDWMPFRMLFEGAVEAGFTEAQALQIVIATWLDGLKHLRENPPEQS